MLTKNKSLTSTELLKRLQEIFKKSGFAIISCGIRINNFTKFKILKNNQEYLINVNIRNITSAYLPNKPDLMRRQVNKLNFNDITDNTTNSATMLLGLWDTNGNEVLAAWNPFLFIHHEKNRSCYVLKESLNKASQYGFYQGKDSGTNILVCSENNFEKLLSVYLETYKAD